MRARLAARFASSFGIMCAYTRSSGSNAVLFHSLPEAKRVGSVRWAGKATVSFSDAITTVRRCSWSDGVFPQAGAGVAIAELPTEVCERLLSALAPAP